MKYIYLTTTTDGFLYVGKHSWDGEGLDPSYSGSGYRLKDHRVLSCVILEDTTSLSLEEHNLREIYWITVYAKIYGVAPFKYDRSVNLFAAQYMHGKGKLLNCHAVTSCTNESVVWWVGSEGPYSWKTLQDNLCDGKSTISSMWCKLGYPDSFYWHGYHIHKEGCTGGPVQVSTMSKDARLRARDSRRRTLFDRLPVYTNGVFQGNFYQIAEYIGYSGSCLRDVSGMLRGKRAIPKKYSILATFHPITNENK